MKKISQILMAAVLTVGLVSFGGGIANAADTQVCDTIVITNTGPGSYNSGTCTVNVAVDFVCSSGVYILNDNSQNSVTGAAEQIENTTVAEGASISGTATNSNGTTVELNVTPCGETTTPETPVTPTTPETPVTPTTPETPVAHAQKVTALPNTASNQTTVVALVGFAVAALAVVASRIAIAAYRRSSLK